jgi:hypothetical protein
MRLLRILFGIVVAVQSTIVALLIVLAIVAGIIGVGTGAVLIAVLAILVAIVALALDAVRPTPPACGLVRRVVFRDTCEGACPAGQACTVTATRPYGPRLFRLAPQAAACACVPLGAPGGLPGGPAGSGGNG